MTRWQPALLLAALFGAAVLALATTQRHRDPALDLERLERLGCTLVPATRWTSERADCP
jgi:hypothetical protein